MDYPGAFMEYQEAYRIPWSSIEFQEAPWNTKELSRNTKKFVGIPGGRLWRSKQTDRYPHTYTHQEAFMKTKKLFSNTMLLRNAKKLSCNTKKLLWITKTVYGIERGYSGISRSFYVIPRSPYPGAFKEYQEALSNTMKLDGIPRRIPRTCPEIRRSSLEYQEALTNKSCKFVPRFRLYKVTEGWCQARRKCHEMAPKR